jgi:hypothetical protein
MKILASRIAKELKKAKHCAVYEPDLSRVWPDDGRQREPQIASFAKCMAGGSATTKTDSAQFSIKTRLTKETSSSVQKRRQLFLRTHNETRSVAAMRISNPDRPDRDSAQ